MRRIVLMNLAALLLAPVPTLPAEPPALMLAEVYEADAAVDLSAYWVSEKLDGVRGYWNGRELLTRGGERIAAPDWYTAGWPDYPLDGELWIGRGRFDEVSGIVRQQRPDQAAWRRVRFMLFDLPGHEGDFDARLRALRRQIPALGLPWLRVIEHFRVADEASLQRRLDAVVAGGGEGLMLHRGDAPYRAVRSDDLLKLKPYDDAEARVIGYSPGQGKYQGLVGALLVETADGRRFKLGSGLSDDDRREPPALGSWVTYRYNGLTGTGLPRFARYLRVREAPPPPDPPVAKP